MSTNTMIAKNPRIAARVLEGMTDRLLDADHSIVNIANGYLDNNNEKMFDVFDRMHDALFIITQECDELAYSI